MSTVTIHLGRIAAHIRPKTSHFQNARMEAWRLKYCLDNDTTRFAWADTAGGKGVIYRMTDEHGNDCPYDFKNVQFKRYKRTAASPESLNGKYVCPANRLSEAESDIRDTL